MKFSQSLEKKLCHVCWFHPFLYCWLSVLLALYMLRCVCLHLTDILMCLKAVDLFTYVCLLMCHACFCILITCHQLLLLSISQEEKIQNEIEQLEVELKERDAYIQSRTTELRKQEALISTYIENFSSLKSQRDELQDTRKYVLFQWIFSVFFHVCANCQPKGFSNHLFLN